MSRILIIDDDPDLVDSVCRLMAEKKHEMLVAYSGEEGIITAREQKPDAIILDVMMPGKDGYSVCKELKADPCCRAIPVLLLTAVVLQIPSGTYTMRNGMETEADDYIDKPVAPDELVSRVEALLT